MYALTNHIDKLLLEKYFKNSGVGTLLLFSSLISAFVLPIFWLMDRAVLDVSGVNMLVLSLSGVMGVVVLWCYLLALKDDEASIVVVFYQLVPVFSGILGYFFLGEILTQRQLIAMALVILGTTIISFEIDSENKFKLRRKTILLMLTAALCWAIDEVLFKAVALEENVWRSLFWSSLMILLSGIIIFIAIPVYRYNFLASIRNNSKGILSLNFLNEALYIVGNVAVSYAVMLAPVGLVMLTESFQPIFVMAIGIVLTIFFPKLTTEKTHSKHILQKSIAICITGIGTYLLLKS